MKEARVSVLVTFYNQEKYVDKTLKSIIDQETNFGVKILVGDDGSSDGTCACVEKWIEKYPENIELHIMDREPGKHIAGFRASRNRLNLLKYVKTDYFIYLDGDDYFTYKEKLQKQVEILDAEINKDCISCGHNIDMLYLDGRRNPIISSEVQEGKYDSRKYWKSMYIHTDTLLTRSEVISTIPQQLLENNFNDNMITFTFIQNGKIYYIPESWGIYLQTGDGIWTTGNIAINHIRNMFLYDLCNQINPDMKKETTIRFSTTWKELFILRNQIDLKQLELFSVEAKDKKLVESYKWIHYKELNSFSKIKLCLKAVYLSRVELKNIIRSKLYNMIGGR